MEINSVLDALRKKDYEFVFKHLDILLKDGIRENYLNEYNSLAVMLTKLKRFENTINLYTELKRKDIEMKPMDEEEAILEMELLGHSFFVYKDMDTNKTCVLYKRKDGDYGLIETK